MPFGVLQHIIHIRMLQQLLISDNYYSGQNAPSVDSNSVRLVTVVVKMMAAVQADPKSP
jgi:hypothetical protein